MINARHIRAAKEILWTRKIHKDIGQLSNVSLADKFDCSVYQVYRIARDYRTSLIDDDVKWIKACIEERERLKALLVGYSQKEIFTRHSVSYKTVIPCVEDFAECGARV